MGEKRTLGGERRVFRRMTGGLVALVLLGIGSFGAGAQQPPPADGDTYGEIQKMIENLESRVGKVGEAVPPETLESLEKQVEEAVRLLSSRSEENVLLRGRASGLSEEIESMAADREELSKRAAAVEKERDERVAALERRLEDTNRSNTEKERELERLGKQLEAVVAELATLNAALEKSETQNRAQKKKIVDLDGKLKSALAADGKEMARYRSEFFEKLSEVLGDRQDVRIVGDRFVFQSELLFASGEAKIGEAGMKQLEQFAKSLAKVTATIPKEIDWVLRVDGHTDKIPVNNNLFPSNWELSTARAVSVVKFLIEKGIPPERLVAAGFGEFQPLDPRYDEIAFRRNRRIEFKLTQK